MPLCYLLPLRCENCLQSYGLMTKQTAQQFTSNLLLSQKKKTLRFGYHSTTFFLFPVFPMNTWSDLHVNVFNHVRCPLWCCPPSLTTTSQFLHSFTITITAYLYGLRPVSPFNPRKTTHYSVYPQAIIFV